MVRSWRARAVRPAAMGTAAMMSIAMLASATTGAAAADDGAYAEATKSVVAGALDGVDRIEGALLLEPVSGGKAAPGRVSLGQGVVDVPVSLEEGVTLTGLDGKTFSIELPFASSAGDAVPLSNGAIAFPGKHSANAVIVGNVGVQMLTAITDKSAPTRYSYEIALEPGQSLALVDGGAAVLNADGAVALTVASAWARDANGVEIPTRYEVVGSTLTQVVEHTASDGVVYPVVADPIWIAPWIYRCLIGIGLNGPQIARIASSGSLGSVLAAFGYGALRCILGR